MIDSIQGLGLNLEIDPDVIPTGINPDPTINFDMKPKSIIGKITKLLGSKVREVPDDFEALHESVIERWKSGIAFNSKILLQKHGKTLDSYKYQTDLPPENLAKKQGKTLG